MDIEATVARRISKAVGVPAYLGVPQDAPQSFVCVEQTGGYGDMLRISTVDIDCWAGRLERKQARTLADRVCAAVPDLDEEPNIFGPEVTNVYRQNDPDTGRARYVVQVQLRTCE